MRTEPAPAFAAALRAVESGRVVACALVLVSDDGTTEQYFHAGDALYPLMGAVAVLQRDVVALVLPSAYAPGSFGEENDD